MNKIRELRKEKGLTLNGLSKELQEKENFKIGSNALGKYERGLREPKLKTWQILAKYFDVSMLYLQGLSDTKKWTPEKGREAVKKANIKEFNSKYCHDEKILQNISDDMKPIINNFDDDISVLKAILLSSNNKNNQVISMNTSLMFLLSAIISNISQNLLDALYPSENDKDSEVDNDKMLLTSMGYIAILKDTLKKTLDFHSENEEEKITTILNSLDIDVNDFKEKINNTNDETTNKD